MRRELLRFLLGSVAGGLPPRRPDQVMPSTAAGVAPGAAKGVLRARQLIISGPGAGAFLYSGTPGPAGLVESMTEAATDPFNTPVNPGFASYDRVFGGVAQLHGSLLKLFSGTTLTGQYGPGGWFIGAAAGPQVKALVNVNLAVSFLNPNSGAAPTDVASVTNLQQVVELPSNNASEVFAPLIGEVVVTYTDGDLALCTVMLGGAISGVAGPSGYFTALLAPSSTGLKVGAVLSGTYAQAAGHVTLVPNVAQRSGIGDPAGSSTGLLVFSPPGIRQGRADSTLLIPAEEQWRQVGGAGNPAFAAGWSNFGHGGPNLSFKRVAAPDNGVWINGLVTPGAGVTVLLFTLPAAFFPISAQVITGLNVSTGAAGSWTVGTTGAVTAGGFGGLTAGQEYAINGFYSLDV